MKKLMSVLMLSLFASSAAFAGGHAGAAPVDGKKDEMKKEEMKKDTKKDDKKKEEPKK